MAILHTWSGLISSVAALHLTEQAQYTVVVPVSNFLIRLYIFQLGGTKATVGNSNCLFESRFEDSRQF